MIKDKKISAFMTECYVELYKNSTPPADFNKLVKTAKLNEFGQKIIPFMKHSIDEEKYHSIVNEIIKKHKIPKLLVNQFRASIALGCSPTFKKK